MGGSEETRKHRTEHRELGAAASQSLNLCRVRRKNDPAAPPAAADNRQEPVRRRSELIAKSFIQAGFEVQWGVVDVYPGVKQSIALLNNECHEIGMELVKKELVEVDRGRRLLVNDLTCPFLVVDCQEARKKEIGSEGGAVAIDKQRHDPHGMDGIRYAIWALLVNSGMDDLPFAVAGKGVDEENLRRGGSTTDPYYDDGDLEVIDVTKGWNQAEDY